MAKLRQNIWFLFALLFFGSCVLLIFFLHQRWQLVVQEHLQQQHTQVQQLTSSIQSLLSVQQVLADLYHDHLVQLLQADQLDDQQGSRLLDHLLENNHYATAYAVAHPDGDVLLHSSNLLIADFGNLRQISHDHGLFEQALHSESLVLGRTFFISELEWWAIPARQSLRAPDGEVIAVLALGISLHHELKKFVSPLLFARDNHLSLIREHDGFFQFFYSNEPDITQRYETPIALSVLTQLQQRLEESAGTSLQQLKYQEAAHSIRLTLPTGHVQAVLRYLPEYQLWAVSELDTRVMRDTLLHNLWRYIGIFLLSQLLLFLLVRTIAQADRSRRAELLYEATHDQLTGLPNRNYLRQYKAKLLGAATSSCYLLFLDLDNFKTINDSFGHELGDRVLKEVSRRIKSQAGNTGAIVRHGGDEFLIFLPDTSEQAAMQLATALIKQLSSPYQVERLRFVLGASIGIAHYPDHANQLDDLVRAADIAMYEAKKTKNNIYLYSKALDARYQRRFAIEQRLRTAIEQQHLFMVYQPQIDREGQLYGVEALVRWQDPVDGFIPPDQFVPVAESSGQMPLLGQFILQQAFTDISKIQQQLERRFQLSLNISVRQLLHSEFLPQLAAQIQQYGMVAEQLTLELTESILIEDHDHVCQLLGNIKQLGCKISMDDFGTGYSSLSMLRTLPVDELKIDKSFVDCMRDDETCRNMTASIIAIGQRMKLLTIAEGVEHGHERDLLLQMGCELYQGYFFAKPMPAEQLLDYLQQHSADHPAEGANFNPGQ